MKGPKILSSFETSLREGLTPHSQLPRELTHFNVRVSLLALPFKLSLPLDSSDAKNYIGLASYSCI